MRKQALVTGEYYHIYNRGVDKRDIFTDKKDLTRFIESILAFNQIETITSLSNLRKNNQIAPKALSGRPLTAIVVHCLNPNHFHFVLKQLVDGGIAKFMQKLQAGYTSYFNIKNSRTGSLLQGTFRSQHMGSENYFNKILGYANKNYQIHSIPKGKMQFVVASDSEYESGNFKIVSKEEGKRILEIFGGNKNFKKHCDEIVSIIRAQRGKLSLLEEENVPDSA
ncbi:MAG: hypothetical protein WD963_00520 [Candidatus Paceibacterota bacterium]